MVNPFAWLVNNTCSAVYEMTTPIAVSSTASSPKEASASRQRKGKCAAMRLNVLLMMNLAAHIPRHALSEAIAVDYPPTSHAGGAHRPRSHYHLPHSCTPRCVPGLHR